MLEQSKTALAEGAPNELAVAEIMALRYLAVELEQNLIPADEAKATAQALRDEDSETRSRTVYGILLGLRSAFALGYHVSL